MTTATDMARAEFMRLLSEHEDLNFEAGLCYGNGPKVGESSPFAERIRMSRRAVVAAFDQAALMRDPEHA